MNSRYFIHCFQHITQSFTILRNITDSNGYFHGTEIDWRYVMKRIRILDLWFFRGLFYFYVGFITIENDTTFTQPQDIIGLTQISMGACYVFMVSYDQIDEYEYVKVLATRTVRCIRTASTNHFVSSRLVSSRLVSSRLISSQLITSGTTSFFYYTYFLSLLSASNDQFCPC